MAGPRHPKRKKKGNSIDPIKTSPSGLDLTRLDSDAVRSIQRLDARGFETYLVGGCVRDLLLDRDPKDYDLATEARPQQVKRAFPRNCRIIGRRFKLAHLHFDSNTKILEVATFRSSPVAASDETDGYDEGADAEAEIEPIQNDEEASSNTNDTERFESDLEDTDFEDTDIEDTDIEDADVEDTDVESIGSEDSDTDEDTAAEDTDAADDESELDPDELDSDSETEEDGSPDTTAEGAELEASDEEGASDDEETSSVGEEDLLIVRDNEFGTVEEDAVRRDFTINALFLDPITDEIIDYVGGMADVEARLIRTIGDPETRFREDPVRILRAAKFAGRLRFRLDPETEVAMRRSAEDLVRAAPPRILEEILRLLRGGHALPSFQILRDVGGLAVLLPHVHSYLEAADAEERRIFWRTIDALDNHVHNGGKPSSAVTLGCLFLRPILHRFDTTGSRSLTSSVEKIIGPLAQELRLPRRDAGALKRICSVQPRFTATGKRRFRLASFLQDPHLLEAMELFELTCFASRADFEQLEHWRELIATERVVEPEQEAPRSRGRDRGRGRDRNRDRGESDTRSRSRRDRQGSGRSDRKDTPRKSAERKQADRKAKTSKRPAKKAASKTRPERRKNKQDEVLTIEPEAYDLSAFDRELAPREVPRFDTIVEAQQSKKKRRVQMKDDDSYKPPPPPGGVSEAPPPPPPADDVFGDW